MSRQHPLLCFRSKCASADGDNYIGRALDSTSVWLRSVRGWFDDCRCHIAGLLHGLLSRCKLSTPETASATAAAAVSRPTSCLYLSPAPSPSTLHFPFLPRTSSHRLRSHYRALTSLQTNTLPDHRRRPSRHSLHPQRLLRDRPIHHHALDHRHGRTEPTYPDCMSGVYDIDGAGGAVEVGYEGEAGDGGEV